MNQVEYAKQILKILSHLRIIVSNIRLYSWQHTQVESQLGQLFKEFMTAFSVRPEITLLLIENDLIINNKAVRASEQKNFSLFIKILQEKEVGFVTFRQGMKKSELRQFVADLASLEKEVLQLFNGTSIKAGKVGLKKERGPSSRGDSEADNGSDQEKGKHQKGEVEKALSILNSMATERLDIIKEYYDKIKRFGQCETRDVENVVTVFVQCFAKNMNPLAMLANQKEADDYTFTHVVNVCILTLAQAAALGFTGEALQRIGVAASLHDVGKIFLSSDLLNKVETLSLAEENEIKMHSVKGASYLLGLKKISRLAFLGALEHHMQYDGQGYPAIGGGFEMHLVSQMIAVSDTFDAMRSNRSYQEAKSVRSTLDVLREGQGTVYNPMLVDNFIRVIKSHPQFV